MRSSFFIKIYGCTARTYMHGDDDEKPRMRKNKENEKWVKIEMDVEVEKSEGV